MQCLISANSDPTLASRRGMQPLHYLCMREVEPKEISLASSMLRMLLTANPPLDELDGDDASALHYCAAQNNLACAHILLEAGANPNIQSRNHDVSPLHIAMLEKNFDFADLLYAYGAVDTIPNKFGQTPRELLTGKRNSYKPPNCGTAQEIQAVLERIVPHNLKPV